MIKLEKEVLNNKEVLNYIKQIAGDDAIKLIKLFKKKSMSPEQLSKKLNEKITNVRSILNSLHYRGIACYRKEKNELNMYQFFWNIKYKKIFELLLEKKMEEYKKIEEEINKRKNHDYFYCTNNCGELAFEIAAIYNFKCPNCNKNLQIVDSKSKISSLKRRKNKIKKDIDKLEELLNIKDNVKGYICE